MAKTKTKITKVSPADFVAKVPNETRRKDAETLLKLFGKVTGWKPKMWGPSIVGYGSCRYTYESGRTGEMFLAGFAIRGRELVVYLVPEGREQEALLSKLGKHKMGKSCLYFKRLADLDKTILQELVANSMLDVTRRYGAGRRTGAVRHAAIRGRAWQP